MSNTFEHFDLWYDDQEDDDKPFCIAVQDSESDEERWIMTSISVEDAIKIRDYINSKL